MSENPRILWVHNFATHYTSGLFELVAKRLPVKFLFFSQGGERYWLKEHGTQRGAFQHEYLRGCSVAGTRIVPELISRLLTEDCAAVAKCVNGKFALPVTYCIARLRRKPFILYTGIWMRVNTVVHRLGFPIVRHIYRNADAIVVYGEHVKKYLVGEGVQPDRIFVEKHAVDNQLYSRPVTGDERGQVFTGLGLPSGARFILYVGRLEEEKGVPYLLEAFASLDEFRDAVLVLAGVGSGSDALQAAASRLGVSDRVKFTGYIAPADTASYYAAAWAFVLPSVTTATDKETWGLVVNEAFNQGLPVIATDAVGAAAGGLVEDGVNGLIVPERNPGALAAAMRTLLSDPAMRSRMSLAARAKIAHWDQPDAAELIERALRFAVRGKGAGAVSPSGGHIEA